MESRFLLTRRGCSHCLNAKRVVSKLNLRLPIDKRIKIVDCFEWEEFGLRNVPIMEIFEKMGLNQGYPFLYVDGCVVEPAPTPEVLKTFLTKFLQGDFII